MASKTSPFRMTIDLNVLEHLGINLYSNVPSVLSEVVANAWDADAPQVSIELSPESVVIHDSGVGMTAADVNERFLTVGYRRRDAQPGTTPGGRLPMGRKGIGKLSLFSIADSVEVRTRKGGQASAFRMSLPEIRKQIKDRAGLYEPEPIDPACVDFEQGTCIVLTDLKRRQTIRTGPALRKRIARRFSIIGPRDGFEVHVDGVPITPADRDYYSRLQYLWTYGDQTDVIALSDHLDRDPEERVPSGLPRGITISGWLATVKHSKDLKDEDGDNLNRIAINVRGKMAEENVLGAFSERSIFATYLLGEIRVDALDLDEEDDAATSSRQSIVEDDPRYVEVKKFIAAELRYIENRWADWRTADGAKIANTVPEVAAWLVNLTGDTKRKAERWIGRLNVIESPRDDDKKELLKASILAFESYRRKDELDKLENLKDDSLDQILAIFRSIDDLELSYYGQIVKLRIGIIRTLQSKLRADDKELILRDYIFDHLWLLDPAWERTKGTEHAETLVNKFLAANTTKLKGRAKTARIDIGYRTIGGKHVIIELKRASVAVPVDELMAQIRVYRDGARRILEQTTYKNWPIEIVCLLGKPPPEWKDSIGTGPTGVIETLRTVDARIVFYDELLTNAQSAYADYLDEHVKIDKLWSIFEAIDDFTPSVFIKSNLSRSINTKALELLPAPASEPSDDEMAGDIDSLGSKLHADRKSSRAERSGSE